MKTSYHKMFLIVLTILGMGSFSNPLQAKTFSVNSTSDMTDLNPGDGICRAARKTCTLRAAIQEANALSGTDRIRLSANTYTLTITGGSEDAAATGDLDITESLTIVGAGSPNTFIDGSGLAGDDRIFHVDPLNTGVAVTIRRMTIQNASAPTNTDGGAILVDEQGQLTVKGVSFIDNSVNQTHGTQGYGGAIYSYNSVSAEITNSIFRGNQAYSGGALYGDNLTVQWSRFLENSSIDNGGALVVSNSTISNSIFTNNTSGSGGAMSTGNITVENCGFFNNVAYQGGAIDDNGSTTIMNSTFSGNEGSDGGAIYSDVDIELINNTITANNAGTHSAAMESFFGSGAFNLKNNIIYANSPADCTPHYIQINSQGYNIDGDGSCNLTATGDLPNTDPLLGSLGKHGGFAPSYSLTSSSPAIDAGDNTDCPSTDQRGLTRPADGDGDGTATCDIGAYEY